MSSSVETAPRAARASEAPLTGLERFGTFTHAVAFVAGFTTIFVLVFGLPLYAAGQILGEYKPVLALVGAFVVMFFGLSTMDVIRVGWMNYDTRKQWAGRRDWGYFSSYFMGVFFAAGWSPCIGTTLGAIMTMSYSQATAGQGLGLLLGYSLGMGLPFLLVGAFIDMAARQLRRLQRHMHTIKIVSGLLLIGVGLLVLFDALPQSLPIIGQKLLGQPILFSWPFPVPSLSTISALSIRNGWYVDPGDGGPLNPTLLIAFAAGLLSFLSPCVLPLVPAYVSYLSGRAVGSAR